LSSLKSRFGHQGDSSTSVSCCWFCWWV